MKFNNDAIKNVSQVTVRTITEDGQTADVTYRVNHLKDWTQETGGFQCYPDITLKFSAMSVKVDDVNSKAANNEAEECEINYEFPTFSW